MLFRLDGRGPFLTATAVLVSTSAFISVTPARADELTDQIVQGVVQNILQNVRDKIQNRTVQRSPRALQFTEDDLFGSNEGLPFNALGYSKVYTKAPPVQAIPPSYLYGFNAIVSGDYTATAGIRVRSVAGTGAVDITKIGVLNSSDALTFIMTGIGIGTQAVGFDATTAATAGTLAYISGGFSADFTVSGYWTDSTIAALGTSTTSGVSYSPNIQYKFELGNSWFIEPTVGVSYSEAYAGNFNVKTGDSTEVHGGARVGNETAWNGIRFQPTLAASAYSIVSSTGSGAVVNPNGAIVPGVAGVAAGTVGGRGSAKLNVLWTDTFSSYVEAHGNAISGSSTIGGMGGVRWTF